jgi:hydroxymethylglutaryl-CoA lyase
MVEIDVVEVCPRDGLQNEDAVLPVDTKVALIDRLVRAGCTRVEAVSFVNPRRVPQMAGAEEVLERITRPAHVRFAGLVLNERGMDRALACDLDEVNIVVPCTDEMSLRNQGLDARAMASLGQDLVRAAHQSGRFAAVTAAVAFGCPVSGEVPLSAVARVFEAAAEAGADEIVIADTIGVGVPDQVADLIGLAREIAPGTPLRFHFHNTRNTGYANAMRAVAEGVTAFDSSVGGFGGCPFATAATGNIATEDLNYALTRSGHTTSLDHEALVETAQWLSSHLGTPVSALLGRAGLFVPEAATP